jgi:hypothetical protein
MYIPHSDKALVSQPIFNLQVVFGTTTFPSKCRSHLGMSCLHVTVVQDALHGGTAFAHALDRVFQIGLLRVGN